MAGFVTFCVVLHWPTHWVQALSGIQGRAVGCITSLHVGHLSCASYSWSHLVPPLPPPSLLPQHVPLLVVLTYLLLSLCKVVSPTVCWLSLSGTLTAWTYLRFFQPREQGGRGDMTEEFAFATLLPEIVQ